MCAAMLGLSRLMDMYHPTTLVDTHTSADTYAHSLPLSGSDNDSDNTNHTNTNHTNTNHNKPTNTLNVVGIDMLRSKLVEANVLIDSVFTLHGQCDGDGFDRGSGSSVNDNTNTSTNSIGGVYTYHAQTQGQIHNTQVNCQTIYGDFVDDRVVEKTWGSSGYSGYSFRCVDNNCVGSGTPTPTPTPSDMNALYLSITYICATVYDTCTMDMINKHAAHLSKGCLVIILDKHMNCSSYNSSSNSNNSCSNVNDLFELISSCQVEVTWGVAHAYVYEKQ